MIAKIIKDKKDTALLIIRIFIGIIFTAHGVDKLQIGVNTTASFFTSIGIPAGQFFAWFVTLIEIFGGLALIFGVLSRVFALFLSIIILVAIVKVKFGAGLIVPRALPGVGMELDLALLSGLLSVLLQGPGKYSLELKLFKKELC